jgi:tetratricopeptide (TPR) repeat protein/thiol-disulfide isomerase/thioredoxin
VGGTTAPAAKQAAPASAAPSVRNGLSWFEDAPDAALAAARASGRLVLVDLWAPWCHSCLSMQAFVLTAEKIPALRRFVLLSINTERESNAAFLERVPVTVWPTFYVLEPSHLAVLGRWLGSGAPGPFTRFLSEGERARDLGTAPGTAGATQPEHALDELRRLLRTADELATHGDFSAAAAQYGAALALAPAAWARRPETLVAQMTALHKAQAVQPCLELAEHSLDQTGNSSSTVDFADYALDCAERAGPGDARVPRLRRAIEERLRPLCERGSPEFSPDDRADACAKLADARTALQDVSGAHAALETRLAVLEQAAQGLPDDVAVAYDWAFTDTLLALGRPEQALTRALARERALPDNYNPPQYAARAYQALGRYAEGLAAIDRALGLAYGPRKIGFLTLKADLLQRAGRSAEALDTVRAQLAAYRALPAGQRQPAAEARVERRLRDWK